MKRQLKILIFINVVLVSLLLFLYQRQTSWEGIHKFVKSSVANYIISVDYSYKKQQNFSFINVLVKKDNAVVPTIVQPDPSTGAVEDTTKPASFVDVARSRMSPNGVVILAYFDYPFLDSALNFYETSLKPFGLNNFVFTVSDSKCCEAMADLGPGSCFVYRADTASDVASSYGNADFKRKMNIRTDMILDCLKVGITVLHSDIDVFFMKNPLDFIDCKDCDIAPLMDTTDYNAGFLYIRPTPNSIKVYERMKQISIASPHVDDQDQLTQAIGEMKSQQPASFILTKLSTDQFQCGLYYYENGHHTFAGENPCSACVVVHNNWIVSMEAKEYRCKETGMWNYDGGSYFSNPDRKYLTYSNPVMFENGGLAHEEEHRALVSALAIAQLLNRTLILPALHCEQQLCTMLNYYRIAHFDKVFKGQYRESVFLRHPKVPDSVLKSKSPLYFVASTRATEIATKHKLDLGGDVKQLVPAHSTNGALSDEVIAWWEGETASVLQLHSLYYAFDKFRNEAVQKAFDDKIKQGLTGAGYRQF